MLYLVYCVFWCIQARSVLYILPLMHAHVCQNRISCFKDQVNLIFICIIQFHKVKISLSGLYNLYKVSSVVLYLKCFQLSPLTYSINSHLQLWGQRVTIILTQDGSLSVSKHTLVTFCFAFNVFFCAWN